MSTHAAFRAWPPIVVLACTLAGCAGGTPPTEVQLEVTPDISTWALPSDAYAPPPHRDLAFAIEMSKCLRAQGYDYPIPRQNPQAPLPATTNAVGRRLFNKEIAERFGYHLQLDPSGALEDVKAEKDFPLYHDPQFIADEDTCYSATVKHFGEPDSTEGTEDGVAYWQTGSGRSPDLGGDRLWQALEQWRQCMAPLGIADLTTPLEFPTPALANQWQLNSDIPLLELGDSPSADEVRIAVHDATCQESSGWAQAYYEESWRVDEEFVRENYTELEALQAEYADLARRYEAAIAAR